MEPEGAQTAAPLCASVEVWVPCWSPAPWPVGTPPVALYAEEKSSTLW
jgi:hypothetical protein